MGPYVESGSEWCYERVIGIPNSGPMTGGHRIYFGKEVVAGFGAPEESDLRGLNRLPVSNP